MTNVDDLYSTFSPFKNIVLRRSMKHAKPVSKFCGCLSRDGGFRLTILFEVVHFVIGCLLTFYVTVAIRTATARDNVQEASQLLFQSTWLTLCSGSAVIFGIIAIVCVRKSLHRISCIASLLGTAFWLFLPLWSYAAAGDDNPITETIMCVLIVPFRIYSHINTFKLIWSEQHPFADVHSQDACFCRLSVVTGFGYTLLGVTLLWEVLFLSIGACLTLRAIVCRPFFITVLCLLFVVFSAISVIYGVVALGKLHKTWHSNAGTASCLATVMWTIMVALDFTPNPIAIALGLLAVSIRIYGHLNTKRLVEEL